jgi:hypothetical protein
VRLDYVLYNPLTVVIVSGAKEVICLYWYAAITKLRAINGAQVFNSSISTCLIRHMPTPDRILGSQR